MGAIVYLGGTPESRSEGNDKEGGKPLKGGTIIWSTQTLGCALGMTPLQNSPLIAHLPDWRLPHLSMSLSTA